MFRFNFSLKDGFAHRCCCFLKTCLSPVVLLECIFIFFHHLKQTLLPPHRFHCQSLIFSDSHGSQAQSAPICYVQMHTYHAGMYIPHTYITVTVSYCYTYHTSRRTVRILRTYDTAASIIPSCFPTGGLHQAVRCFCTLHQNDSFSVGRITGIEDLFSLSTSIYRITFCPKNVVL